MKKSQKDEAPLEASKAHGRIYTPDYLVRLILDYAGYRAGDGILRRHVIDNSCGDGAFLCEIVGRYCQAGLEAGLTNEVLARELGEYVHGIEIDAVEQQICVGRLDEVARSFGVHDVEWDVICADTLTVRRFDGRMDFVVGNPPYVRVHNLKESYDAVKHYRFAQQGMTDLFIVFFEIGFRMLSEDGRMCIITPSSWLSSRAGEQLRKHVLWHRNLSGVIDLEHFQAFNATTYTLVSRFDQRRHETLEYCTFGEDGLKVCDTALRYDEAAIGDTIYLSSKETLRKLRDIRSNTFCKAAVVKNGFATLADKVFIGDFSFKDFTIPVVKASTGQWKRCVFPYDERGRLISEAELSKSKEVYEYLLFHKEQLTKGRSAEAGTDWFAFGRSQAILDVSKKKFAINTLLRDVGSIKLEEVKAGEGVYSGLYILANLSYKEIADILLTDDFVEYIKALKNYKSGGYYTFSSRDLSLYINNKIQQQYGQQHISGNSYMLF